MGIGGDIGELLEMLYLVLARKQTAEHYCFALVLLWFMTKMY
jgi:hypothetical protein